MLLQLQQLLLIRKQSLLLLIQPFSDADTAFSLCDARG